LRTTWRPSAARDDVRERSAAIDPKLPAAHAPEIHAARRVRIGKLALRVRLVRISAAGIELSRQGRNVITPFAARAIGLKRR
jgi:hypothetical protein